MFQLYLKSSLELYHFKTHLLLLVLKTYFQQNAVDFCFVKTHHCHSDKNLEVQSQGIKVAWSGEEWTLDTRASRDLDSTNLIVVSSHAL